MTDDEYTIDSGHLEVGDGHKIYYQSWGYSEGNPIFVLHGGPGSKSKDKHKLGFNPKKQHVIFHDQRGCGQSLPLGKLEDNNTQELANDITKLKEHLKIKEKITLFGGSWGSALALYYAVENPQNVHKMLLNGIYTGTKKENDYIQQGGMATHFPETYDSYLALVPKERQTETTQYYLEKMQSNDTKEADKHTAEFFTNEAAGMSIDPDIPKIMYENSQPLDDDGRKTALLEPYYFVNNCFIPDSHILDNAEKLKDIPTIFVQGRFDHVCPPVTAYNLSKAMGDNCHLHIVPAAHATEGSMRETLRAYIHSFLN